MYGPPMPEPYDPPPRRPVEVLHTDGRWYGGFLLRWTRKEADGWYGLVEYNTGLGENRCNAQHESRIRLVR